MSDSSKKVLVVGSANVDLVTRVPRCPKPGESLVGSSFTMVPGGKGANQAVAAARLGASTTFIGCLGGDAFGTMLRENLNREGVSVENVKIHPDAPTGTACIYVTDDGNNAIVVTPAANQGLTPADVEAMRSVIAAHDVVLTQLEIQLESVEALLRIAREENTFSMLDAGPVRDAPIELCGLADLVSPNETETEALCGVCVVTEQDAIDAASHFHRAGAETVVLKLGVQGAMCSTSDRQTHVSAFRVDAIDTVAAGDAFTAALAIAWGSGSSESTLRYANAVGALATTKPGAQDAMPTHEDVARFLETRPD